MDRLGDMLVGAFVVLLAATHPHAAAGAAFGCCFFLALPHSTNHRQRALLGLFSFGIGYAAGVFTYGGGPPYSEKAMFVAGGMSALAAVIWAGLHRMAAGDGPLPQWLRDILGFIPMFRGKGPGDGL